MTRFNWRAKDVEKCTEVRYNNEIAGKLSLARNF